MKKLNLLIVLVLLLNIVTGCGKETKTEKNENKEEQNKSKLVLNKIYYDKTETDFEKNSQPDTFIDDFGSEIKTQGYVTYITFKEKNKATAVYNACMGHVEKEIDYKITFDKGKEYIKLKGFIGDDVTIEVVSEKELRVLYGAFDCGLVDDFVLKD